MNKILLLSAITTILQMNAAAQRTCNCLQTIDSLILKLEADYIGLHFASVKNNNQAYLSNKTVYRKKAAKATATGCTQLLQDFLSTLKDQHVFVYEQPSYTTAEINQFKAIVHSTKKSAAAVHMLAEKKYLPDSIEGIWTDGSNSFVIVKEKNNYNAYLLPGEGIITAGELKASFTNSSHGYDAMLYNDKYEPAYSHAGLYKKATLLGFNAGKLWAKTSSPYARETAMINPKDPARACISRLNDSSVLFSIPTFNYDWDVFSQLVKDSLETLANASTIIFDIRGNTGGNALYFNFIELIADKKVFQGSQGWVLACTDTRQYFQQQAGNAPAIYQPVIKAMEDNIGKIVEGPLYPGDSLNLVPNKIKNVAILTDEYNISAAESFILHARAVSSKITTFGKATGGCIDYTSVNILALPSGNQHIYFGYPTSTWDKLVPEKGYNKTGIIPDVAIDDGVKDKIAVITDYYLRSDSSSKK